MISLDTWVLIVKYAASATAVAYGVYATLNDFHVKRNGKEVLARSGYFGISFLLIAGLLGICSDVFKDRKDDATRKVDDLKRAELLAQEVDVSNKLANEVERSEKILRTTERAAMPLPKDLLFGIFLDVDTSAAPLANYAQYLHTLSPTYPAKSSDIYMGSDLFLPSSDPANLDSGEQDLLALTNQTYFSVVVLNSLPPNWNEDQLKDASLFSFNADCSKSSVAFTGSAPGTRFRPKMTQIIYQGQNHHMAIECLNLSADTSKREGAFSSLLDFGGKYLVIRVGQWRSTNNGVKVGTYIEGLGVPFDLRKIELNADLATRLAVEKFEKRSIVVRTGNIEHKELAFIGRIDTNPHWGQ